MPNYPTPAQIAAWRRMVAENLSTGIFRIRTDEPAPVHCPGDAMEHVSVPLSGVLRRLTSQRAPDTRPTRETGAQTLGRDEG